MAKKRRYNSIDRHVSKRIRARREELGFSQTALGKYIGVTFQQVQKIEGGTNRISAGNLWKVADFLSKPVVYFYEGMSHD